MIIPESHTRNTYYFQSLSVLQNILNKAGFNTRLGSLDPKITSDTTIQLEHESLIVEPIKRVNNRLVLGEFDRASFY